MAKAVECTFTVEFVGRKVPITLNRGNDEWWLDAPGGVLRKTWAFGEWGLFFEVEEDGQVNLEFSHKCAANDYLWDKTGHLDFTKTPKQIENDLNKLIAEFHKTTELQFEALYQGI